MLVNRNLVKCHNIDTTHLFDEHDWIDINIHRPELRIGVASQDGDLIGTYIHFNINQTYNYVPHCYQLRVPLFLFKEIDAITTGEDGNVNCITIKDGMIRVERLSKLTNQYKMHVFDMKKFVYGNKYIFGTHWKDYIKEIKYVG